MHLKITLKTISTYSCIVVIAKDFDIEGGIGQGLQSIYKIHHIAFIPKQRDKVKAAMFNTLYIHF